MSELKSHVFTEIEIDATADQVGAVLTYFEKLPEWSSSFLGVNKSMALGEVSIAYFKNPVTGGKKNSPMRASFPKRDVPLVVLGMRSWGVKTTTFSDRRTARWARVVQTTEWVERLEKQFSDLHGRGADWQGL